LTLPRGQLSLRGKEQGDDACAMTELLLTRPPLPGSTPSSLADLPFPHQSAPHDACATSHPLLQRLVPHQWAIKDPFFSEEVGREIENMARSLDLQMKLGEHGQRTVW
jgi:hypothetical protein